VPVLETERDFFTTDELVERIIQARDDADYRPFIETLLIQDKDGEVVRLAFNEVQELIHAAVMEELATKGAVRLIILKARQGGASTYIQGLGYTITTTHPNHKMWVVAHDRPSSEGLAEKSDMFLDMQPENLTPMVRHRDRKRIRFENKDERGRKTNPGLRSSIYVDQAKNVRAGRSTTIQFLHMSEVAFWIEGGEKTRLSLMQAVPNKPGTIAIAETTANGVEDPGGFYEFWSANYNKPNAKWRCLFIGWPVLSEYQMEVADWDKNDDGDLILRVDPDGEMREDYYRQEFSLTDEQLYWRRWCIETNCGGDIDQFMQEYPCTPEEAFITSGRPWYSRDGMEAIRQMLRAPISTGVFEMRAPEGWTDTPSHHWRRDHFHRDEFRRKTAKPSLAKESSGEWWLWSHPTPGREYLISVDSAEGGADGDRAAIRVRERDTLEDVAEFNGYLDTDLLAHQAALAAAYYNGAWVIPEVNNTGYGFMTTFTKLWSRIYWREDPDAAFRTMTWRYGFLTRSETRNRIVCRHRDFVREKTLPTYSSRLFSEMLTFVKDKSGTPRASGKKNHDDLVLADCMLLELSEQRPRRLDRAADRGPTLADDKSFQKHVARRKRANTKVGYF
jgi:hypothetical protein